MENDSGLKKIFVAALLGMLSLGPVFAMPDRSWGQSSGPGVWNFLDFGNWDVSSLDAGTVFRNLPALAPGATPPQIYGTNRWNKFMNNGWGMGVGVGYWFNDHVALRLEAQGNMFINTIGSFGGLASIPLTGGIEVKLLGNDDTFLYMVADAGGAYEVDMQTPPFFYRVNSSGNAWSPYGDAGIGVNIYFFFIEVKVAALPDALPNVVLAHPTSPATGLSQSAFWYIPVTGGFNF